MRRILLWLLILATTLAMGCSNKQKTEPSSMPAKEALTVAGIVLSLEGRRTWGSHHVKIGLNDPTVIVKFSKAGRDHILHAWPENENDYNVPMMRINEGDLLYEITNDEYQFLAARNQKASITQKTN